MSAANQVELVLPQKRRYDLVAENKTDSSLAFSPHFDVGFGVSPEQVAKQPSVRNISGPDDGVDLFDAGEVGRESSVHAENFIFNDSSHGHAVETVHERFPKLNVVPVFTYNYFQIYIISRSRRFE